MVLSGRWLRSADAQAAPARTPAFEQQLAPSPKLQALAQELGPSQWIYFEALGFPADAKRLNVAAAVPKPELASGVGWIQRVVSPRLIPKDPETAVEAIQGVARFVARGKDGKIVSTLSADYLVVENSVDGQPFRFQENAESVTVITRLPTKVALSNKGDVESLLTAQIPKLLDFPRDQLPQLRFVVNERASFYYGRATTWKPDPDWAKIISSNEDPDPSVKFWWWQDTYFITDGSILFVGVYERDGNPPRLRPQPGYPRRFEHPRE